MLIKCVKKVRIRNYLKILKTTVEKFLAQTIFHYE